MRCWGFDGDHMYKDCPHKGNKMRTVHNIEEDEKVDDAERGMSRIYESLDNKKAYYQPHMIEIEGTIFNQTIAILIDFGASHGYVDPKSVERIKLNKFKHTNIH
jgi:hypothetical protein